MDQHPAQNLALLIKDADALARALNIHACSPELQLKIIGEWSSVLFKRLLLRIPDQHTREAQRTIGEMYAEKKDAGELIAALARYIPDFERFLNEEIARAVNEFRLAKTDQPAPP